MSTALLAVVAVILCILFRMLNVHSQPQKPFICCADRNFLDTVNKIAPLIREPYIPTRLWGFSGHIQTIIHSIIGRVKCPWPIGERVYLTMQDNSTLTYDLYQALGANSEDDVTVAIVPGIGNSSESVYIRTFVHWAQCHGYRCAVLNHIGALRSVPVTAPRIFSYGQTNDFHEMLLNLITKLPHTRLVCVGFSLGGNLVTKYMGEVDRLDRPTHIIGAISICQGYNAIRGTQLLLNWSNFRRFYLYIMTENMKGIILRHRNILLSEDVKNRHQLVEHEIISAATLPELDDAYTKKMFNFRTITELYQWSSCINYIDSIKVPMVFINSRDDPIVHEDLLKPIKDFASTRNNVLYLEVAHGGHLGFYEGGMLYPNPVSWLDRALVVLIGSLVLNNNDSAMKTAI